MNLKDFAKELTAAHAEAILRDMILVSTPEQAEKTLDALEKIREAEDDRKG